jgi:hypothetical protein
MELEILDALLKYLLHNSDKSFSDIKEDVKLKAEISQKVENNTLDSALVKLVKDGYVNVNEQTRGINMNKTPYVVECYNISFEGMFFIKNGGYRQASLEAQRKANEYELLNAEQKLHATALLSLNRRMVRLTWAIAIGTLIASVYYFLEILHFFGVYFDTSNFLFCIKPT